MLGCWPYHHCVAAQSVDHLRLQRCTSTGRCWRNLWKDPRHCNRPKGSRAKCQGFDILRSFWNTILSKCLDCIFDFVHVGLHWHSRMLEITLSLTVCHALHHWKLRYIWTNQFTPPNLSSNLSRIHAYPCYDSHVLSPRSWHITLAMLIGSTCLHPAISSDAQGMATAALDGREKTQGNVALPMVIATEDQSLPCIIQPWIWNLWMAVVNVSIGFEMTQQLAQQFADSVNWWKIWRYHLAPLGHMTGRYLYLIIWSLYTSGPRWSETSDIERATSLTSTPNHAPKTQDRVETSGRNCHDGLPKII